MTVHNHIQHNLTEAQHNIGNRIHNTEHTVENSIQHVQHAMSNHIESTENTIITTEQHAQNNIKQIFSNESNDIIELHESALTNNQSTGKSLHPLIRSKIQHYDSKDELIDLTIHKSTQHKPADNVLYQFGTYSTPMMTRQHTPVTLPHIQPQSKTNTNNKQGGKLDQLNYTNVLLLPPTPLQLQPVQRDIKIINSPPSHTHKQQCAVVSSTVTPPTTQSQPANQADTNQHTAEFISHAYNESCGPQLDLPVCIVCESSVASVYCSICDLLLCTVNDECDQHIHTDVQHDRISVHEYMTQCQHNHTINDIPYTREHNDICVMCETNSAQVYCEQCELCLCIDGLCDRDLHNDELMYHTRIPLNQSVKLQHDMAIDTHDHIILCDACQHDKPIIQCHTCNRVLCNTCDINQHTGTQHQRVDIHTNHTMPHIEHGIKSVPVQSAPIINPESTIQTIVRQVSKSVQLGTVISTHDILPDTEIDSGIDQLQVPDQSVHEAAAIESVDGEHVCDECGVDATVYCSDCRKYLCNGNVPGANCDLDLHYLTVMRSHHRTQLQVQQHTTDADIHHDTSAAELARMEQQHINHAAQLKQKQFSDQRELLMQRKRTEKQLLIEQRLSEQMRLQTEHKLIELQSTAIVLGQSEQQQRNDWLLHQHKLDITHKHHAHVTTACSAHAIHSVGSVVILIGGRFDMLLMLFDIMV